MHHTPAMFLDERARFTDVAKFLRPERSRAMTHTYHIPVLTYRDRHVAQRIIFILLTLHEECIDVNVNYTSLSLCSSWSFASKRFVVIGCVPARRRVLR
jgi:hypothetical protein